MMGGGEEIPYTCSTSLARTTARTVASTSDSGLECVWRRLLNSNNSQCVSVSQCDLACCHYHNCVLCCTRMLAVCGAVPGALGSTGGGQRERGLQPAEQQVGNVGSRHVLALQARSPDRQSWPAFTAVCGHGIKLL